MKTCITTVCSANCFQYYIPLFLHSWKTAYPNATVKVFLTGPLSSPLRELCESLAHKRWTVHEHQFSDVVKNCRGNGVHNALRYLVSEKHFANYRAIYVTDVDLLGIRTKPTHFQWFGARLDPGKHIAAYRSPYRRPRRPEVYGKDGWRGIYTRVAAGTVLLTSRWWAATRVARDHYLHIARAGGHDRYDKHEFGSYREYDEVMLQRILRMSGIAIPERKYRFYDGARWPALQRGVHLGDFKFRRHARLHKMRRLLPTEIVRAYCRLERDPLWQRCCEGACENDTVREMLRRLRKFAGVK